MKAVIKFLVRITLILIVLPYFSSCGQKNNETIIKNQLPLC